MEEATLKGYIYIPQRNSGAVSTIQTFLGSLLLYKEVEIFAKTGGRSGDMGKESINFEIYYSGKEAGCWDGMANLYVVTVDNTNGYCQLISITAQLPKEKKEQVRLFLEGNNFASNYTSFKDRPVSFPYYRSYWDECLGHLQELKRFQH